MVSVIEIEIDEGCQINVVHKALVTTETLKKADSIFFQKIFSEAVQSSLFKLTIDDGILTEITRNYFTW